MKKEQYNKGIKLLVALLFLLPFMITGITAFSEKAFAEEMMPVTLHKKDFEPDVNIQNTGNTMAAFEAYEGIAKVDFKAYDITAKFYDYRDTMTVSEARQAILAEFTAIDKDSNWLTNLEATFGDPVDDGTTDTNGDLTLDLAKTSGGKDAAYLIIETDQPETITKIAEPMILIFPAYRFDASKNTYTDQLLDVVHLYPKNTATSGVVELTKKVNTLAGDVELEGAEFVIHRNGTYDVESGTYADGTEFIESADVHGNINWATSVADAHKFITDSEGKFTTDGFKLAVGDYYITEVSVPDFENQPIFITNDVTNKPFTIDAETTSIELEGKNSSTTVNKTTMPRKDWKGEIDYQFNFEVGKPITYTIDVFIPENIADTIETVEGAALRFTDFGFIDTYSPELTWLGDYQLYDGSTEVEETGLYTVDNNATAFTTTVDFNIAALEDYAGKELTFTYQMAVNETALPDVGYDNKVELNVTHDNKEYKSEDEGNLVYTGGKRFVKVDYNNQNPLAGAEFVVGRVRNNTTEYMQKSADGKTITWVSDITEAKELTSNNQGILEVTGLEYGEYFLEETKAPSDEYIKLVDKIDFTVALNSYSDGEGELVDPLPVANKAKGILPNTGGIGKIGILLIGGSCVILGIFWYRKNRKKTA